eukprot:2626786-Heterocapsa_arctica.AAC.1
MVGGRSRILGGVRALSSEAFPSRGGGLLASGVKQNRRHDAAAGSQTQRQRSSQAGPESRTLTQ